jgi:hypothetical protein
VRPRHAPHRALVALERLGEAVRVGLDFEDFDGLVRGAGREAAAVVVEDGVVLGGDVRDFCCLGSRWRKLQMFRKVLNWEIGGTYDHVIVGGV